MPKLTKRAKNILLAACGVVLATAIGVAAYLRFGPTEEERIQREIAKAGYCSVASDCEILYARCPFGCSVGVNKAEASRIQAMMEGFPSTCEYMCVATAGVDCVSGRCKVRFEGPAEGQPSEGVDPGEGPQSVAFQDDAMGLSFRYRTGEDGYVVIRPPSQPNVVVLYAKETYDQMNGSEGTEGPPAISVQAFSADGATTADAWVKAHPQHVGDIVSEEMPDVTVGGERGIRWEADGLYRMDSALVLHGGKAYLFTASWLDAASPMRADLSTILNTVEFQQ